MTCEQIQEHLADYLAGNLPASAKSGLEHHLAQCAECREELAIVQSAWDRLALLPSEMPSSHLRTRFYDSLEAYQQGARHAHHQSASSGWAARLGSWTRPWWPARPVAQLGLAVLVLAGGVGIGRLIPSSGKPAVEGGQMAQLREEIDHMRELVTLSMLQQQSASERLQGVTWSARVEPDSPEVSAALLRTMTEDANVNVRLAAVDALQKFVKVPEVRQTLIRTLPKQNSPMVQVAMIDLLVQIRERQAMGVFKQLAADEQANAAVRERATWGLQQFAPRTE